MDFKEVISKQISFQPNAWGNIEKEISIGEVIKEIKRGKYANEVNQLRNFLAIGDKDRYDIHKKRLPGVTFCGNFDGKRKKEQLKNYHNLIVIDIDKLTGQELSKTDAVLNDDKYVFTFWLSPSELGFKGLVYLDYKFDIQKVGIDDSHKMAFEQLTEYFANNYSIELDISGSDTTRLCFLSFDKNLKFKPEIYPFPVELQEPEIEVPTQKKTLKKVIKTHYVSSKDVLNNPKGKNDQRNKKIIARIIKFLKNQDISITSTYDEWYRVAYAIANSFTYDIGEKYFLSLCEIDGVKHDEIQSKNMLLYCYQNSQGNIKFSTITFMAKNKGFKI